MESDYCGRFALVLDKELEDILYRSNRLSEKSKDVVKMSVKLLSDYASSKQLSLDTIESLPVVELAPLTNH